MKRGSKAKYNVEARRTLFVELFTTPGGEHFGHAQDAALAAGYGDASTVAGKHVAAKQGCHLRSEMAQEIAARLADVREEFRGRALRVVDAAYVAALAGDVAAMTLFLKWAKELTDKVEVTGDGGGPLIINFPPLS